MLFGKKLFHERNVKEIAYHELKARQRTANR